MSEYPRKGVILPTGANVFSSFRDGPLRAFGSSSLDLRGQCPFWPFSKGDNRTSGNPAMPPSPAFMCPGSRAEKARQSLPTPLPCICQKLAPEDCSHGSRGFHWDVHGGGVSSAVLVTHPCALYAAGESDLHQTKAKKQISPSEMRSGWPGLYLDGDSTRSEIIAGPAVGGGGRRCLFLANTRPFSEDTWGMAWGRPGVSATPSLSP